MKNIFINSIIAILFLLVAITAFAEESGIKSEAPSVEIIDISGQVEVSINGREYEVAEEDMFLLAGDKIKTGRNSYVELAFDEEGENVIRIEEESSAIFMLGESEKLEMLDGEIFSTINKLRAGSSFEIKTPTAVCGARGTDWVTLVTKLPRKKVTTKRIEASLTRFFMSDVCFLKNSFK